jgi:nucleoid-associated protein YgaU
MNIFRKKSKADFSNVQGGSSSTAPAQPAQPEQPVAASPSIPASPAAGNTASPSPAGSAARTYTVAKGDTLSAIAQREYGAASKWKVIYEANRDKISNPDRIQAGQVLVIPSAQ